jgi:hypothetical protein
MGVLYLMCWRRNYPQDRGTRPSGVAGGGMLWDLDVCLYG